MKRKIAALYDPYLNILGGGERFILSILKILEREGFQINIFWNKDLSADIKEKLGLRFKNVKFIPNIFSKKTFFLKKAFSLSRYDLFFYIPDGSYFLSLARKNYIYAMVPNKNLYPNSLISRFKTFNYHYITHSRFTKKFLRLIGIKSSLLYPYLDDRFLNLDINKLEKDRVILSVGRFYKHLHAKRQDLMINLFKKIKRANPRYKNFKLILAGGLKDEDRAYYDDLLKLVDDDQDVILKVNISFDELLKYYQKAEIYWHFAGFGVDEKKYPYLVEHLGISPLEAMASGCLTFCYQAGGPKEIIEDGVNGFLFATESELLEKMEKILNNKEKKGKILQNAKKFVLANFNYELFSEKVKEKIL